MVYSKCHVLILFRKKILFMIKGLEGLRPKPPPQTSPMKLFEIYDWAQMMIMYNI